MSEAGTDGTEAEHGGRGVVEGERGAPIVARARSVRTRVQQGFAGLVLALTAGGFLFWYYTHLARADGDAEQRARRSKRQQTVSEMKLPPIAVPLGPELRAPIIADLSADPLRDGRGDETPAWLAGTAEPAPERGAPPRRARPDALSTPVWVAVASGRSRAAAVPAAERGGDGDAVEIESGPSPLARALQPTVLKATAAAALPERRMLLPKGSFIDCTLETAIDSTLPGLATCVTAVDVYGVDGSVVLLERGTRLIGEVQSAVRQGQRRVFVLWNEARTPTGVVAPLVSPGTDALGRSGLGAAVNTHFMERFGAALFVSIIEGVAEAIAADQRAGGAAVFVDPRGPESVATEIIRRTGDLPPTLRVPPGAAINVLVARDVDFRSVYALRAADPGP
jgi:type IV secretion system protein VirB10